MGPMRAVRIAVLAACLAAAAGCASEGGSGGRDAGGASAPDLQPGTSGSFSAETRRFMADGLRAFSRNDPGWDQTRARWLALGPRESQFLVSSMFAALLAAQARNAPALVERARHELALIGAPSVGFLSGVLATGTVATAYDAIAEEERPIRVDDDARREAAQVLGLIGAPAAQATADAAARAETKSGRRFALVALGTMGERGGAAASSALARYATDPDWVLRVEAVQGLAGCRDATSRAALEQALGDSEDLVREKAAEGLVQRGERGALPALQRALSAARAAGRVAEVRRLDAAVRHLESGR